MKSNKITLLVLGILFCSNSFAKDNKNEDPKCAENQYKYRISYSYIVKEKEMGFGYLFTCFDRKIETQEDWNWLQTQFQIKPKKGDLTVMSANLIK